MAKTVIQNNEANRVAQLEVDRVQAEQKAKAIELKEQQDKDAKEQAINDARKALESNKAKAKEADAEKKRKEEREAYLKTPLTPLEREQYQRILVLANSGKPVDIASMKKLADYRIKDKDTKDKEGK